MKNINKGDGIHNMNYDTIMELDNLTIQDCENMYKMRNMCAVIDDGRVVNFEEEIQGKINL